MRRFDESGDPVPFQMKVVSVNRSQDTGGEIFTIDQGVECVGKKDGKVMFNTRFQGKTIQFSKKDPRHWKNSTRNILVQKSRQFRTGYILKVHIRLIIEFNHQKVIY
jgi:hypothetical protein